MGKASHGVRRKSVRIEPWEIEVAKNIARSIHNIPDRDDLEGELLKRLLELKTKSKEKARDWRGLLIRSLQNAATDMVRRRNWWRDRAVSLESTISEYSEESLTIADALMAPDENVDLKIELSGVWKELSPEMRDLWSLLVEEGGNGSSLARRIGVSQRTVSFWIAKIREALKKRGLGDSQTGHC